MDTLTMICLTILFFYCLSKILQFYGVSESTYAVYLLFYIFIALCLVILPQKEPEI
jgi:hypothetical protein